MSPTSGVASQLRQLIYYNIDNNLLRNALFLAGRLHGFEPRASEAAYLLALCHLRLGEFKLAYDYSKASGSRGTHLGCAYVHAQACLALERYGEGITALEKSKALWSERNSWGRCGETRRAHMPDAAAAYCLLGKLAQAGGEGNRAVDAYTGALKVNPFMWDAFLGLCDLGVNVRIPNIYRLTPEMMAAVSGGSNGVEDAAQVAKVDDSPPLNVSVNPPTNLKQETYDPFNSTSIPANAGDAKRLTKVPLYEKLNGNTVTVTPLPNTYSSVGDGFETPTNAGNLQNGNSAATLAHVLDESEVPEPPLAPARKPRSTAANMNGSLGVDPPARFTRPNSLRSRPQSVAEGDESDETQLQTRNPTGMADRKRTASGQVTKASVASTRNQSTTADPTAAPQRKSVRLLNQGRLQPKYAATAGSIHPSGREPVRELKKVKGSVAKSATARNTAGRVVSGNRRHGDVMEVDAKEARAIVPSGAPAVSQAGLSKVPSHDRAKDYEGLRILLELFTKISSGYFALTQYHCAEALQTFSTLSTSHRETPWVLAQMGRALYEQARYAEAEKYFSRMRLLCPARLEDAEIHSTVLWHLKAEIDLAALAHETVEQDRLAPEAWCAVGNSLALENNHEKALAAFGRATQLDPRFAYAWTLQGHEHVANEEYDKALAAYRAGIEAEPRHYNAYYGLGRVYEKQGKYEMAEEHYRIAAGINPTNAVLLCCIGGVLEKMKRPKEALAQYGRSCELAPKSALSRFKKARVLMMLGAWEKALQELLVLKDIAPDEANVHFLLGRAYKALRAKSEAVKHFTAALNLDPKASHHIKEVMEQLEDDFDEDDEDDDGGIYR